MKEPRTRMKIMHGMQEIAGQAYYAVKGLVECGYEANLVIWSESEAGYPSYKALNIHKKKIYLLPLYIYRFISNCRCEGKKHDLFHFHFGNSLIPFNLDLWWLKRMGKKIVFEFHGSDIRGRDQAVKNNPYFEGVDLPKLWGKRCRLKRMGEKYPFAIVLHDDELIPYLPGDWLDKVHVVPLRIDIEKFFPLYPDEKKTKLTIAHAPSNKSIKGTKYVCEVVEKLSKEFDIEFVLVENMPLNEAIEVYRKADIIVDQLIVGTYGVFAIEAMALGKPVITYVSDEMKKNFPEELPIISGNPDNLEEVLRPLLQDGKMRRAIGIEGRKYVETYHDGNVNARLLSRIYEGKNEPKTGRAAFNQLKEAGGE